MNLDTTPIDSECNCMVCQNYSKSILETTFYASKELTYFRLASIHNLYYYLDLMAKMRESILKR